MIIDQFVVRPRPTSGDSAAACRCCSPTGSRAKAPSTRAPALSATSRCAPRTTCAVVYPTTAAQYFHVLRRQANARRPASRSSASRRSGTCACRKRDRLEDLTAGAFEFVSTTLDRASTDEAVRGCSLCTGKIGHELMDERDAKHAPPSRSLRIEQLYPWPRRGPGHRSTGTPTRARCGGYKKSRRTWARGHSCTSACTRSSATRRAASHRPAHECEPRERQHLTARSRTGELLTDAFADL